MNSDIDCPEARIIRSEALKWWAALPGEERIKHCARHHGDERHPATLTGREIEKMYVVSENYD